MHLGQRGLESVVNELLWEIYENMKDIYIRVCVYNIKDKFIMMFGVGSYLYGMCLQFSRKKKLVHILKLSLIFMGRNK